jgi:aspartate racemase
MQSIGLIGGLSWESTALYYQVINREVSRRLGKLHSACMTIRSLDFEQISTMQKARDWDAMAGVMRAAARDLVASGAQCILIGSNTMHRVAPEIEADTGVPLLHIVDATARAILQTSARTVGLLGTRLTMEQSFYTDHLARHGITCVAPLFEDRMDIDRIIFNELFLGQIKHESRKKLASAIARLVKRGAEAIVLGCTELPLIVRPEDSAVPLFDTTRLHSLAAVDFCLEATLPVRPPAPIREAAETGVD